MSDLVAVLLRGRRNGKTEESIAAIIQARERGEHVHVMRRGWHALCVGGDPDCPWWELGKRALPPDYSLR